MDDRALSQTMLGWSEPWTVERGAAEPAVPVFGTACPGPDGGATVPVDDQAERRWRQLDTCHYTTRLVAHVPRVQCGTHGVTTGRGPWAEKGSRVTLLVERLAIAWLQDATTPTAVARRLGLTWDAARGMPARAVRRDGPRAGGEGRTGSGSSPGSRTPSRPPTRRTSRRSAPSTTSAGSRG